MFRIVQAKRTGHGLTVRQRVLGLVCGGAQPRQIGRRHLVDPSVQLPRKVGDDAVGEILSAQEGVAGRGAHLHHARERLEDRHVEGAAAQIDDQEGVFGILVLQTVGQRRRRRFVDQAAHRQTRKLRGGHRGLALDLVEIGRHRDDGLGHGRSEIRLRVGLQ